MKSSLRELTYSTRERRELVDITKDVADFVRECEIETGICLVAAVHSTAAIIVNEAERGLMQDILSKVQAEFPQGAGWMHDRIDDNADAHLASAFLGGSKVLPIKDGRLYLGTWQSIFLLELDGPRTRTVICEAVGD